MKTRKTVKPRRPRRNESPRYQFRMTQAQDERLKKMGRIESRKFCKYVRERFDGILNDWDFMASSPVV